MFTKISRIIRILYFIFKFRLLRTVFTKGFLETNGYLKSLELNKPVNRAGKDIPWCTYSYTYFIEKKLSKGLRLFEYGCGHSTLFYSRLNLKCYGVEDNINYAPKNNKNIKIYIKKNKKDYIEAISLSKIKFDIIIVDGKYRNECLYKAVEFLTEKGIIVLDNSDRVNLKKGITFLISNKFKQLDFKGITPQNFYESQTSIFYKNKNCLGI